MSNQEGQKLIKEDVIDWWRAGSEDSYDVGKKILRTGCRQLQRNLIECQQLNYDYPNKCTTLKQDYTNCRNIYEHLLRIKQKLE